MLTVTWSRSAWLGICLAVTAGCASPWSARETTSAQEDARAVSPNGNASKSALNVSNQPFGTPRKSSAWSTLQGATSGLTNALTIKPKVIPASDPTSLSSNPADVGPELYIQLARQLENGGLAANALRQYHRALDLEPNNAEVLVSMARLLDREGQAEQAIQFYRRAAQAEPDNPLVHNDLGLCYARHGQAENSIAAFRQSVRLEPTRDLYRNNLATSLVRVGQPAEALRHLLAVHSEPVARYNLGYLLQQQGHSEAARQEFLAACQLDPRMDTAREMLRRADASRGNVAGTWTAEPVAPVAYLPPVHRLPATTTTR